jgi:hypothetical protein
VPSQAAEIARPSPIAPPIAARPTANDPIAGKNHELPPAAPWSPGVWAVAVTTANSIISVDITNSFSLSIIILPRPKPRRRLLAGGFEHRSVSAVALIVSLRQNLSATA